MTTQRDDHTTGLSTPGPSMPGPSIPGPSIPGPSIPGPSTTGLPAPGPSRGRVFGQVYGRSVVVAVAGGAVIGLAIALVLGIWAVTAQDDSLGEVVAVPLWGAYFGAAFGLVLGVVGGLLVAVVAAIRLVPYRGERDALITVRVASLAVVAVFMVLLFAGATEAFAAIAGITAAGLLGAWWSGPFLIRRYLRQVATA